jgi:hypothetical protein
MAQVPNPPDKHHYIPEFHLRRWTDGTDKLWRYTKPYQTIKARYTHVSAAGFENGLYTMTHDEPSKETHLETEFFAKVDNFAAQAIQRFLNGSALAESDVLSFIIYLRSLMHRTPFDLKNYQKEAEAIFSSTLEQLEKQYQVRRTAQDPQEFEDFVASRDPFANEHSVLRSLPKVILNPKIAGYMAGFHWYLIDVSSAPNQLLISDNPVLMTNGLAKPMGHVAIALTPNIICIGAPEAQTMNTISRMTPNQMVKVMNAHMVTGARKFVASTNINQEKFIKNHFGTKARYVLVGSDS